MFYKYTQNNSGGYYIEDSSEFGVCRNIFIEAADGDMSYSILKEIGNRYNASGKYEHNFFDYCSCCGLRWDSYFVDFYEDIPEIEEEYCVHYHSGVINWNV